MLIFAILLDIDYIHSTIQYTHNKETGPVISYLMFNKFDGSHWKFGLRFCTIGRSVRSTTIASVLQITTTPPTTTTPIIPKKITKPQTQQSHSGTELGDLSNTS